MTPDANDLCVFAVKRGYIENSRQDVHGTINRILFAPKYLFSTQTLGQIVNSFSGGTPDKSGENSERFWNGNIPWVSPKDFKHFYLFDAEDHISQEAILESSTQIAPTNSVLVVVRSGILKHTLPVAINKVDVTINQDIKVLTPKGGICSEYLGYFLKVFEQRILKLCVKHSTTVQSINSNEFFSLEIPVPPIEKQIQFVSFMDNAAEGQKKKLEKASELLSKNPIYLIDRLGLTFDFSATQKIAYATTVANIEGRIDADYYSPKFSHFRSQIEALPYRTVSVEDISEKIVSGFAAGKQDQADNLPDEQRVPHLRPFSITPEGELSLDTKKFVPRAGLKDSDYCKKNEIIFNNTNSPEWVGKTTVFDSDVLCAASNHMTRITVKDGVNPYYVAYFFNLLLSIGYWKLLCTNFNNQAGVNTDTLKAVRIPLPDKSEQDQIVAEIMQRRSEANRLRKEAIAEWNAAKAQFEKELLGE